MEGTFEVDAVEICENGTVNGERKIICAHTNKATWENCKRKVQPGKIMCAYHNKRSAITMEFVEKHLKHIENGGL